MKKVMWLRAISMMLVASVVISSLTGCSDKTSTVSVIDDTAITDIPKESSEIEDNSEKSIVKDEQAEEEAKKQVEEEAKKQAEEEAKKQAEEEAKKQAEEEAKKQAEEETKKQAEEEAKKQAEEEAKKQAEEEAKKQAEEEARQAEEARIKAEEEQKKLNSFSMMYYLAITAEEIRTSKENRLMLEDIYTSLLNDINPSAIDEITQDHLRNLRDIIGNYIDISTKRERLQFIHNQNKAAAVRSAVPNPLAILSVTNALDWKKLAASVVYTAVDSYRNYKNASESADAEFIMSGWELDDQEVEAVRKNRNRAFDYKVDMVQEYGLDGRLTLSENDVVEFAEICAIESPYEKINRLVAKNDKYKLLGNYWLELADCYFTTSQYEKCIDCVTEYENLAVDIYMQDYNYLNILPKAVVAAQEVYSKNTNKYVSECERYADQIIANAKSNDWSSIYFAAQTYLDLYAKTNKKTYLEKAYNKTYEIVNILLPEQRKINDTYINPVEEIVVKEPDYRYMSEEEKKQKKQEYKDESKRAKEYNKQLKEERETELPSLYEPLVLNCELLFALADKVGVSDSKKKEINAVLANVFLSKPISDAYSFGNEKNAYDIEFSGKEILIPADLLTKEAVITVSVNERGYAQSFNDCIVDEVKRDKATDISQYVAIVKSKSLKDYEWTSDSKITISIKYPDAYYKSIDFCYKVTTFEKHWYGNTIEFGVNK